MRIKGGFKDNDMKALAVSPWGAPSLSLVVMTVTPVAKWPITRRSSCGSIVICSLNMFGFVSTGTRGKLALSNQDLN